MIMMPAVFFGGFSGMYLNELLPEALITLLLTLILIYLTYNTCRKTLTLCRKESIERHNYVEMQSSASLQVKKAASSNTEEKYREDQDYMRQNSPEPKRSHSRIGTFSAGSFGKSMTQKQSSSEYDNYVSLSQHDDQEMDDLNKSQSNRQSA